jgi:MFS family permease
MASPSTGVSVGSGPETTVKVLERVFGPTPFAKLSYTHACSTGADAFFAVSLAGSLFFNVSVGAARPRVIVYLGLTLAPFLVLAPLVGPLIDRFGSTRHQVAAFTCLARGILCLFIAGDLRTLLLYPEAFGVLVFDKAYTVTKSALVPALVGDNADLVEANSRLARISTVAGLVGGAIAAAILTLGSAIGVLRVASLVYFTGAVLALRIGPTRATSLPPATLEQQELRAPTVRLSAGAMTVLRAGVGFLTFLVAFALKRSGEPLWFFGAVALSGVLGGLSGAFVSPVLRHHLRREEPLLIFALLIAALGSLAAALYLDRASELVAVFAVVCASTIGRQGFDSILQRDAPDAARGRAFARFETLYQLIWVLGALTAVILQPTTTAGLAALAILLIVAVLVYATGIARAPQPNRQSQT